MTPFKEFLLLRIPVGEREREWNLKKIAGGLAFSFRLYSKKKIWWSVAARAIRSI